MRNLILILLLVLFFAFIYLLMSRIDRILDRLRKGNLRMEQQRPDPDRKIPDENVFRLICERIRFMMEIRKTMPEYGRIQLYDTG